MSFWECSLKRQRSVHWEDMTTVIDDDEVHKKFVRLKNKYYCRLKKKFVKSRIKCFLEKFHNFQLVFCFLGISSTISGYFIFELTIFLNFSIFEYITEFKVPKHSFLLGMKNFKQV